MTATLRRLCPDAGLAALLALPVVLLAVNPNWVFSDQLNDAWIYFGYFQNLPAYLKAYDGYYGEGRLSVLLPGWVAYRLLPPWWANAGLHLAAYWLAVLAAHYALRRAVGPRAAWLGCLALGCHTFFLRAVGGDYVDGWAVAYTLLCFALLTRAAGPGRWRGWLVAAGLAGGAVAVANLSLTPLLAAPAGFYAVLDRRGPRRPLDAAAFWFVAGFAGLFLALGAASWCLGGRFFFLESSLATARLIGQWSTTGPLRNPDYVPMAQWLPGAGWLVFPAAAAVGAVVSVGQWLVRRSPGEPLPPAVYLQLQLLGVAAVTTAVHLAGRCYTLQWYFYSGMMLIPCTFLALGGQWQRWLDEMPPGRFRCLAALAFVGLAASTAYVPAVVAAGQRLAAPLPVYGAVVATAVLLALLPRPGLRLGVPLLLGLAVANLGVAARFRFFDARPDHYAALELDPVQFRYDRLDPKRFYSFDPQRQECFLAVCECVRLVRGLDATGRVWFWFDYREPLMGVYAMAVNTNCGYRRLINQYFPELRQGRATTEGQPLAAGMTVVVFSQSEQVLDRARASLLKVGLDVRPRSVHDVGRREPFRFRATVLTLVPAAPAGSTP